MEFIAIKISIGFLNYLLFEKLRDIIVYDSQ
jgi:hypothetical protein